MRLLVQPGAHHLQNMGDVAMLAVAVERLQELWPDATIGVITESARELAVHCPRAVPVPLDGRRLWLDQPFLGYAVQRRLPRSLARRVRDAEQGLRRQGPGLAALTIRTRRRIKRLDATALGEFLDWVWGSDAAVLVGAGLFTDAFAPAAITFLELFETIVDRKAPVAMFGQGLGPLTDPELEAWLRRVLPRVDLIALREERAGRPILKRLGVPEERIMTTGDDAIELALREASQPQAGRAIGLCLRRARYSEVPDEMLRRVGAILRRVAASYNCPLVSVPISRYAKELDANVIAQSLQLPEPDSNQPETPRDVVRRIQHCRLVVTGSYHAAVFALALGIPAIGLAQSGYYIDKFAGLNDQFDGCCPFVVLGEDESEERLEQAIRRSWDDADDLRTSLIQASERQLEQGWAAYRRFHELVEARRRGAAVTPPR
jgi:polysaccharide pyruvyl transferase WcaK-like protein